MVTGRGVGVAGLGDALVHTGKPGSGPADELLEVAPPGVDGGGLGVGRLQAVHGQGVDPVAGAGRKAQLLAGDSGTLAKGTTHLKASDLVTLTGGSRTAATFTAAATPANIEMSAVLVSRATGATGLTILAPEAEE